MRDHDRETNKDGAQGPPPPKAKTGGEPDSAHTHADGHRAAHPDILRDEHLAHPANAEPLAGLLSQLQHSHGNAYVQRFVNESAGEKSQESKPAAESNTQGSAQGLDAGTRSQMESAFGEDFGDVRVHTGEVAGEVAGELGARAFARGRDLYFNEGEYNPSTREGQELLAHELTHVVQQRGGSSARGASVGPVGDTFEREADETAASVVRGERAHVEHRSAASDVQRQSRQVAHTINVLPIRQLAANVNMSEGFHAFNVNLHLSSIEGANFDTLHLTVPARTSVTAVDLSGMGMQVQDPGGDAGRVIVIRIDRRAGARLLQITFSLGSEVFVATYQLPTVTPAAAVTAAAGSGGKH
jgi:hypothetical protein